MHPVRFISPVACVSGLHSASDRHLIAGMRERLHSISDRHLTAGMRERLHSISDLRLTAGMRERLHSIAYKPLFDRQK